MFIWLYACKYPYQSSNVISCGYYISCRITFLYVIIYIIVMWVCCYIWFLVSVLILLHYFLFLLHFQLHMISLYTLNMIRYLMSMYDICSCIQLVLLHLMFLLRFRLADDCSTVVFLLFAYTCPASPPTFVVPFTVAVVFELVIFPVVYPIIPPV